MLPMWNANQQRSRAPDPSMLTHMETNQENKTIRPKSPKVHTRSTNNGCSPSRELTNFIPCDELPTHRGTKGYLPDTPTYEDAGLGTSTRRESEFRAERAPYGC